MGGKTDEIRYANGFGPSDGGHLYGARVFPRLYVRCLHQVQHLGQLHKMFSVFFGQLGKRGGIGVLKKGLLERQHFSDPGRCLGV
jgi:hypothetical protein